MVATPIALPDLDALDAAALKALILSQHGELLSHRSEIEHLKLLIAKLRRMQFGRRSEKVERQIEQLELKLEELEAGRAEAAPTLPGQLPIEPIAPASKKRHPLPDHLPRIVHTHLPAQQTCPGCGGAMKKLGEDVSEMPSAPSPWAAATISSPAPTPEENAPPSSTRSSEPRS